ncbi:MAG TPA: glycosyltransferase family 39 protein, partial [Tepidisphaeraceae bacterium]
MMQVLTSEIELPVELKMPAPSSASPAWWTSNVVHWLGILFCLLTLLAYSDYLLSYRVSYIQEVDSQGYYLMAKSFSHFHNPRWPDDIAKFRGHVFIDVGNGEVMTKYSPGWPLLMVPFYWIGGHSAVMWCNTIFGVIAAIAIFLIGLELFNSMAAFICLFLWAFSPMTPAYNAYPLAHCSEVMMTALAILFAIRWGKTGRLCFAGLMGFCMGFMPLIRATTILIWPAIIVAYFVFAHRRRKELAASGSVITAVPAEAGFIRTIASWPARMVKLDWLRMFWRRESLSFWIFLVTFAIPTVFLAIFNWHNFGRPWWAGYHFSGEQDAFTFTFRVLRERFFGEYGSREFLLDDLVWTIGLLGMWLRIGKPGIAWVLALWC